VGVKLWMWTDTMKSLGISRQPRLPSRDRLGSSRSATPRVARGGEGLGSRGYDPVRATVAQTAIVPQRTRAQVRRWAGGPGRTTSRQRSVRSPAMRPSEVVIGD
jgi:hypothetical protein